MPAVHRMAVFHRQIHLKYFLLPATKSQENMLLLFLYYNLNGSR